MKVVIAFLVGGVGWTLVEYWLHRLLGHVGGARNPFTVEHLAHHADMTYFASAWKKAIAVSLMLGIIGPPATYFAGYAGLAGVVGFATTYLAYEFIHRWLHVSPGHTRYGRWARKHHLYHHYSRPNLNEGVTTPFWDLAFGTYELPELVRVPRKKVLPWMLDENAELKAELRGDYVLVGRPPREPGAQSVPPELQAGLGALP